MASASFTEDLSCPICLELFKDPRMLPCGHSFCAPCLEACIPTGQHQGLCPKCRGPFMPQNLAANWALRSLADKARLLKLDERLPTGAGANWYLCTEHEEPLKLFCSQDEAPICVICRDLPQHRGHDFLPIKNAMQEYKEKLKACLGTLEGNLTSTKEKQKHQEENKVKLEVCVQDLLDHISVGFEGLHQVLREKEQNMKETVKTMKEANLEEMEESLKDLREVMKSCNEILARTRAGLEGTDPIPFLSGIKELMERIPDCCGSQEEEQEEEQEEQEWSNDDEEEEEEESEEEGNEDMEDVESEEEDDDVEDVVPVDSYFEEFKDKLDFDAWEKMLESILPSGEPGEVE